MQTSSPQKLLIKSKWNGGHDALFSIVMCVYNEKVADLKASIDSILNQTDGDFEFIIVLDQPKNAALVPVVLDYASKDVRIKVVTNDKNIGLAKSANKAVKMAQRKFIVRMDADDISRPNRLQTLRNNIDDCTDVYFSQYHVMDEQGFILKKSLPMPAKTATLQKILKHKNIICHPTVMIRAEVIQKEQYSGLRVSEDYDLWVRLIKSGYIFKGINEVLLDYRVRDGSMTTSDYYQSYFSLKFIWGFYQKNDPNARLTQEAFDAAIAKKTKAKENFNRASIEYHRIINSKQRSLREHIKLLRLFVQSPQLFDFFFRTLWAAILRRDAKRSGIH